MDEQAQGPHQGGPIATRGKPLQQARAAMVLLHGRGATAASILALSENLAHPDFAYLAPQATGNSWYPYSFLMPIAQNEPGLTSALQVVADLVASVEEAGIAANHIVIGGFSQGACLASEYVARHAQRYGALLVFSGGVIGPPGTPRDYAGSLDGTPVFVGCSDTDAHIPVERVEETAAVFTQLGGAVVKKIYPNMAHTIVQDEIDHALHMVNGVLG